MYVPKSFAEAASAGKTYPLVVVLHGLNGKPLSMIRWFFGHDDDGRDSEWEDRHPGEVEPLEAFVLAPNAFGNAMYRELGEVDVVNLVEWATAFFPIDSDQVTITGASMGGTGAAHIAFRYPDRFAAAEPLCGYHSYFIRKDVTGFGLYPWEKLIAEYRSPALWAENGLYLPLYVWHGKRDYPAKNSGVLIDRYTALGYSIEHEHPDVGHDVWKKAYDQLLSFQWLSQRKRPAHKRRILSAGVDRTLLQMLKGVVSDAGTAVGAEIPGYSVAGKTGTAQKPGPNGYTAGKYVATFVGMVPASNPKLVVLVTVDEPSLNIFGGIVAAPAFAQIAAFDLQYLEVPPDLALR